jgi:putative membrane protein
VQLLFALLTLLLLAVALFALQNADPVTLRFWPWQVQSSVAVVTLAATAAGALIATLLSVATRLMRWGRSRGAGPDEPRPAPGPLDTTPTPRA